MATEFGTAVYRFAETYYLYLVLVDGGLRAKRPGGELTVSSRFAETRFAEIRV